jgi:hypothetical protein
MVLASLFERKGNDACLTGGKRYDRDLRGTYRHMQSIVEK